MSLVEIKVNLMNFSATVDALAILTFIVWLVTLTNVFGIYQYSLIFFGLSLLFACLSPIVKQIIEKEGIKSLGVITGFYFIVLGLFLSFNWLSGEVWFTMGWIVEAVFIISLGLTSATPEYPRYARGYLTRIGWIILVAANFLGSLWFIMITNNPLINSTVVKIFSNFITYSVDNFLFYSATALLFVGWTLYQTKNKERIFFLRKSAEVLLTFPIGIALTMLISTILWPSFWSQLQVYGQFIALTFLIGLIIYVPLSTIKITSHEIEKELTKQISKGVEMKLENIYQKQYRDLEVQNVILQVNKDLTFAQTDIITFKIFAGSYMIPITREGKTIGGVFFGNGYYNINAKYRDYESKFYGDTLVVSHETFWNQIVSDGTIVPLYQPISNAEELIKTAKNKLEKFSTWVPSRKRYKRKKGGDKVSIHFPFFHIDVDEDRDFVDIRIGPIKIKSQGEKSYVRVGPFLAIDDVAMTIKTSSINAMITEETGEEIYFAVSKNKVILKHGTADIYIKPNKIVIFDKNIKVYSTDKSILISSPVLKMAYKKGRSLKLRTENANLKVYADTGIVKFTNAKIIKLRDRELAEKILNMIEEISGDFVRELLEKGTLESFSNFLSNLEF
ncbi:MAG: hypothetical protein J7L47_08920 [Candidatus Odinarchaeota archaeon]|nr:hypothetical protein [Candidatus Odinarchaeota archaeon]